MNTMQIILVVAIGVSLVATFIMKMPKAGDRGRAKKILSATDWLDDNSADGAMVKVTGIARMRDHGERFVSPLSENRCVVLRVRALVRHGVDPRAKKVDDFKIMPFIVEDESGKLLVEATHAVLDIPPVKQSRQASQRKDQALTELGYAEASLSSSEIEETMVEVNAKITLAGKLVKQEAEPHIRIVGDAEHPIAIRLERTEITNEP